MGPRDPVSEGCGDVVVTTRYDPRSRALITLMDGVEVSRIENDEKPNEAAFPSGTVVTLPGKKGGGKKQVDWF